MFYFNNIIEFSCILLVLLYFIYPLNKIETFDDDLQDEIDHFFVHPCSGYLLCKHIICTSKAENDYLNRFPNVPNRNNLYTQNTLNKLRTNDMIFSHTDKYAVNYIIDTILPYIKQHNIKIILFTGKHELPQIKKSSLTDQILDCDQIILWISQNPIYVDHPKYFAFPFGLKPTTYKLQKYYKYYQKSNVNKTIKISNMFQGTHGHLSNDHIRKKYKSILQTKKYNLDKYLQILHESEFTISTAGDREDCYRHYESILMNTIPISNISKDLYKPIFGNSMEFMTDDALINCIKNEHSCELNYRTPNRKIILLSYWKNQINKRLEQLSLSTFSF